MRRSGHSLQRGGGVERSGHRRGDAGHGAEADGERQEQHGECGDAPGVGEQRPRHDLRRCGLDDERLGRRGTGAEEWCEGDGGLPPVREGREGRGLHGGGGADGEERVGQGLSGDGLHGERREGHQGDCTERGTAERLDDRPRGRGEH